MKSVLFVCLGNICRSPLAQGIFEKQILNTELGAHYAADSAGTSGWHVGEPPHSGSIAIARKFGITIDKQKSRPVHPKDGEIFDYIIAMDSSNRESLLSEFGFPATKVHLMRDFSLTNKTNKGMAVPDPWGKSRSAFEEVYRILDDAIAGFIEFLKQKR
jgi:protein-tyrosine phosphatase